MKPLLQSRTVILAIIQAVSGILIAVFTELDMTAYALIVKSMVDVVLRLDTKTEIY